jgi:glycosyltransferase involved in cell wall biosynthesis
LVEDAGSATALVHDYLTQLGGAERVAGELTSLLPRAALFTSAHDRREVPLAAVGGRPWRTSYLQRPAMLAGIKPLLPLLPGALAAFDLGDYARVVSSSSAFAHHARKAPSAVHVCYCCTPPRFLWQPEDYFRGRLALRRLLSPLLARMRRWDLEAAARVDYYVAVSRHIARRVHTVYGRDAAVVYPPVRTERFAPLAQRSGRFLVLSRLVHSKRVELVVEAANRYRLPLDVIGKGPALAALRRRGGPSVRFLGWQPDATVRRALAECTAVVIAGEEDFGLVTVEAQASGRPPVAFAAGGALEIIEDGVTGFLFDEQTPAEVADAMGRAAGARLAVADLLASARRFDLSVFEREMTRALSRAERRTTFVPARLGARGSPETEAGV